MQSGFSRGLHVMKISSKARHAVETMFQLALSPDRTQVSLSAITAEQGISSSYLEQLLADLRAQNLVTGVRGPGGGYRLARSADQITISDIILAIHEEHVVRPPQSNHESSLYNEMWWDLSERVYGFLNTLSLAALMDRGDVQQFMHSQRLLHGKSATVANSHKKTA